MAVTTKVDSNLTGLAYAVETGLATLNGDNSDVWVQVDPNSYANFGAQLTLTQRMPINPSRMRRKGIITDLNADASFQMDLTQSTARDLLPGFFFAPFADKYSLLPTGVTAASHRYNVAAGGGTYTANDLIFAAGFAKSQNNGLKHVSSSTSTTVVVSDTGVLDETASAFYSTPGNIEQGGRPYIRRVGIQAGSGDLSITEGGTLLATSAIVQDPGSTGVAPGDTLTLAGNTGSEPTFTVFETAVVGTPTIAAAGTGGQDGPAVLQGTTGNGELFEINATISGGAVTALGTFLTRGIYKTNPTVLATEPVVAVVGGAGLVGAQLAVDTGAFRVTLASAGSLTVTAGNPEATTSSNLTSVAPSLDVTFTGGTVPSLRSSAFDFTTLGLQAGEWIFLGGDTAVTQWDTPANNGFARVLAVSAHVITVDKTMAPWQPETGAAKTIQLFVGSFINNQRLPQNRIRTTYTWERSMDLGGYQYVEGCIPSMMTITMNAASKVTVEMAFVGIQTEEVEFATGAKPGQRPTLISSQALNTSSDFGRLAVGEKVAGTNGSSLTNFLRDLTLIINNAATPTKALSKLGAIDVTVGDFNVSGQMTAYFTDVATIEAVKRNDDVTLDFALVHGNAGMLFDVPLLALGNGRANVVKDQPIELPLSHDAGWDGTFNWVLSATVFDYLPTLAQ